MNKEEIKQLTASILESRSNTKKIPDLIKALDDKNVSKIALNSLVKVFTSLCKKGDLHIDDQNEAIVKYSKWLGEVFDETLAKLASLLDNEGENLIKELCLTSYVKLLVLSHKSEDENSWTSSDVKRFKSLIEALLSKKCDNQVTIGRFEEFMEYPDAKYYTIQTLARHPKKSQDLRFRQNLLKFLEILNFEGEIEAGPGLISQDFQVPTDSLIKNFNNLWTDFAKIQHKEADIFKRLLILLTDKVLPVLKNPTSFTDFLINSYNIGGSISLLALNGVFFLISNHNLEYPDFYTKLYQLCTPELLHAKYRARFFHLANLFLASSHLPEYLVAAFIKRLSRLCLTAPSNSILLILPFIGNLLIRHKGLLKMIDNTEEHFDMDENDPSKSKAAESGLWEIKTLQNHALPQVAQAAKFINKSLPQMEWNVDEYLEITPEEMFATEAKKKIFVNVPLTFERPKGWSFAKDDLVSNYFE